MLTERELNRALLARQLLLERVKLPVPRAVERMCALQAQNPPSPYIALWSRLAGFRKQHLTRAFERRSVVRATLMRMTLHVVSAQDYPYFAATWMKAAQERTPGVGAERIEELSRTVYEIARAPTTHAEVEAAVGGDLAGSRWRVRCLAPLVHLPPAGTWGHRARPQIQLMEEYLGSELPPREDGATRLVERYLAAFGPASQADLLRFAGVRVGDVRPGLDRLELRRFRDEGGRVLLDVPRAPLPAADTPAPVRFLPKWEESILAYDERSRILPKHLQSTVIRKNGDALETFLVDGVVAGLWRVERAKRKATLVLEPFAPLPNRVLRELRDEGERLVRFVVDDAESYAVR